MRGAYLGGAFLLSTLCLVGQPSFAGDKERRLLDAVRARDTSSVKALLSGGANPNEALPDHSSPLAWAIDRQDKEAVRLLLAAGANSNAKDLYGNAALTLACELGSEDIVLQLLNAGADPRAVKQDGITALALCAGNSAPAAIAKLVEKGADPNAADPAGQTPLMRAAASGSPDNIGVLLTLGANPNAKTVKGATPLFFALQSRNSEAPMLLIDAKADATATTPDGGTLIEASLKVRNFSFVSELINRGTDLSRRDHEGEQPLHLLAAMGTPELVKLAIEKGANPNAFSQPPVPNAPVKVATNTAAISLPAPGNAPKKKGKYVVGTGVPTGELSIPLPPSPRTPIQLAAAAGRVDNMKVLLEAGADPKVKAPDGMTVTLASSSSGSLSAAQYALSLDPNVAATAKGRNVFWMALRSDDPDGSEAVLKFFAEKGAKLDQAEDRGVTPGELVNRVGPENLRLVFNKLLEDHGFSVAEVR